MQPVADAKSTPISDTTAATKPSATQPPVIINFLTLDHEQRPWFVCFGPHQCATLPEARQKAGEIAQTTGQPERVVVFRDIVDWTTGP